MHKNNLHYVTTYLHNCKYFLTSFLPEISDKIRHSCTAPHLIKIKSNKIQKYFVAFIWYIPSGSNDIVLAFFFISKIISSFISNLIAFLLSILYTHFYNYTLGLYFCFILKILSLCFLILFSEFSICALYNSISFFFSLSAKSFVSSNALS